MDLNMLERLSVIRLREEALKIPDLGPVRAMTREKLIRSIALAHKIDLSQRRRGGATKSAVKQQIRELRAKIVTAVHAKHDGAVKRLRLQKKRLKARTRSFGREKPVPNPAAENPTA